jgi:hypothetical protein
LISFFSRSYTRIFTSYSATFLSMRARASEDSEAPEISRCVTSASRADSAMFSLVPFAWKYAHASTLFACACCIAWVMLPAFTLHSAMKVAMIATLSAIIPLRLEPPPPAGGVSSDFSIASATVSERSLMRGCYPGSRRRLSSRHHLINVISN